MSTTSPTALVIGAGIGGITAAARLAKHGYKVTVLEKRAGPGGRCSALGVDGYQFTTGPSLIVMRELYEQAFADLGERLIDHLDLRRIDPSYHIRFSDGTQLALTSDLDALKAQLEVIEPGSFDSFLRYMAEGRRHYELAMPQLVQRNFRSLFEFVSLRNLALVPKLKVLRRHYDHAGKYFRDPRLKASFTFQDMYMGMSPREASALFSMIQYSEFTSGVWFPMGGMHRVIEELVDIARQLGVRFIYDSPVARIDINDHHVVGITVEQGDRFFADVTVANADLPYVHRTLLPKNGATDTFERMQHGFSAVVFYWGLNKRFPSLETHNLFLPQDFPACLDKVFNGDTLPRDLPFYVHVPSRADSGLAPPGGESIMAAVPVGLMDGSNGQKWNGVRAQARSHVLGQLKDIEEIDIAKHIRVEICHSPPYWQDQFNLTRGSTHGLSHTLTQLAYLRPPNRHPRFRNLYFAGASTHPGTGLPTVLVSAKLAVERVLEDAAVAERSTIFAPASIS